VIDDFYAFCDFYGFYGFNDLLFTAYRLPLTADYWMWEGMEGVDCGWGMQGALAQKVHRENSSICLEIDLDHVIMQKKSLILILISKTN
jgi:hypothetical protein